MAAASVTITYQDFRDRAISWWPLPVLAAVGFFLSANAIGMHEAFTAWSLNVLFLVVQFGLVALVFGLGRKQWNFFDHLIGWGDVLFLLSIAALFSTTTTFLLFYCGSLILSLAGFGIYRSISKNETATVPLAGAVAICLMVFVPTIKAFGYFPWDSLPIPQWLS